MPTVATGCTEPFGQASMGSRRASAQAPSRDGFGLDAVRVQKTAVHALSPARGSVSGDRRPIKADAELNPTLTQLGQDIVLSMSGTANRGIMRLEDFPGEYALRVAELRSATRLCGYMRVLPHETTDARGTRSVSRVDLDVLFFDRSQTGDPQQVDYSLGEVEDFLDRIAQGSLSLNDRDYDLHWLDEDESDEVNTRFELSAWRADDRRA